MSVKVLFFGAWLVYNLKSSPNSFLGFKPDWYLVFNQSLHLLSIALIKSSYLYPLSSHLKINSLYSFSHLKVVPVRLFRYLITFSAIISLSVSISASATAKSQLSFSLSILSFLFFFSFFLLLISFSSSLSFSISIRQSSWC